MSTRDLDRFYRYTASAADGECWPWRSRQRGRPMFHMRGESMPAARAAYILHVGPIPEGFVVRHKCDNATCVNPAHLELGTSAQNTDDMIQRGRMRRSCNKGHANTPENRYTDEKGIRRCKPCAIERLEREQRRLTSAALSTKAKD